MTMLPADEAELQARVLATARAEAEARGRSARIVIAEPDLAVIDAGFLLR